MVDDAKPTATAELEASLPGELLKGALSVIESVNVQKSLSVVGKMSTRVISSALSALPSYGVPENVASQVLTEVLGFAVGSAVMAVPAVGVALGLAVKIAFTVANQDDLLDAYNDELNRAWCSEHFFWPVKGRGPQNEWLPYDIFVPKDAQKVQTYLEGHVDDWLRESDLKRLRANPPRGTWKGVHGLLIDRCEGIQPGHQAGPCWTKQQWAAWYRQHTNLVSERLIPSLGRSLIAITEGELFDNLRTAYKTLTPAARKLVTNDPRWQMALEGRGTSPERRREFRLLRRAMQSQGPFAGTDGAATLWGPYMDLVEEMVTNALGAGKFEDGAAGVRYLLAADSLCGRKNHAGDWHDPRLFEEVWSVIEGWHQYIHPGFVQGEVELQKLAEAAQVELLKQVGSVLTVRRKRLDLQRIPTIWTVPRVRGDAAAQVLRATPQVTVQRHVPRASSSPWWGLLPIGAALAAVAGKRFL